MYPFIGFSPSILISISHKISFILLIFFLVSCREGVGNKCEIRSLAGLKISHTIALKVLSILIFFHFSPLLLSVRVIRLPSQRSSKALMMLNGIFFVRSSLFPMLDLVSVFNTVDFVSSLKCHDPWLLWHLVLGSLHAAWSVSFCHLGYYFPSASTCLINVSQSCILCMRPFLLLILSF